MRPTISKTTNPLSIGTPTQSGQDGPQAPGTGQQGKGKGQPGLGGFV